MHRPVLPPIEPSGHGWAGMPGAGPQRSTAHSPPGVASGVEGGGALCSQATKPAASTAMDAVKIVT